MQLSDKQKKLLGLLADGEFHSGTVLAKALGISRAAVWKHLNSLSEWGLDIIAVSGRGYRLHRPLDLLDREQIYSALPPAGKDLLSTLEIHSHIDSTNRHLLDAAKNNAASGLCCFAEFQSAGKGRRGRQWVSPFGGNLYCSVLWRFQQGGFAAISGLSLVVGVAVIRALHAYFKEPAFEIGLKWPNDIFHQGKKLGGILIEITGEAEGPCTAVIGLGLNLFMPETEAQAINQAWTDLSKITGKAGVRRNTLAALLLNHILQILAEFETEGLAGYLDEWRAYDCLKDRQASLFIGSQQIDGVVLGIDEQGLLLIQREDGPVMAYASGEVSFSGAL